MILEHPLRIVGLAGVVLGSGLLAAHVRACAAHDAIVVTFPIAVTITRAPAASADDTPPVAAIPTETMPCVDDATELLVDDHRPVLCWGERCLVYRDDDPAPVSRPDSPPRAPEAGDGAIVAAERVCTGARCDQLGPKLRARLAGIDPRSLSASRDHAALVIHEGPPHFEVWNRAADRPVSLGKPGPDDGELQSVDVIGDHLIITRACNEYCSAVAFVIDARGRHHGPGFARTPRWGDPLDDLIAVDDDLFVAFGGFGEIAMLAHGRNVATADFLPASTRKPVKVDVHAVALDHETVAARWCTAQMCHLTRIFLGGADPGSERSYLELSEDLPLPRCQR
jgi:hypothetical protein